MPTPSKRALIVIDLQNDYFPGGLFPLWNTEETLRNILAAIGKARALGIPLDRVSVKATTTEELGFEGRGEGMSAQAVAMVVNVS